MSDPDSPAKDPRNDEEPRRSADFPLQISFSNQVVEQSPDGSTTTKEIHSILKKPTPEADHQAEWNLITDAPPSSPKQDETIDTPKKPSCPECCSDENGDFSPDLNRSDAVKSDVANIEFVYYSATLREVAPRLTNDVDRQGVILWLRKLFRPEYYSSRFRTKRNKFLLYLTLTLMNDELYGIFRQNPPSGALPSFECLPQPDFTPAEWERDTMWQDVLIGVPKSHEKMECSVHVALCQCEGDTFNSKLLDEEFMYLLYLARPFVALLPNPEDRTKIAAWLQTLCTIRSTSCSAMKYIRNDYTTALLGYIHELRVAGPFSEFPTWDPLPPLVEAARILSESYPNLDPCHSSVDEFFSSQPFPDEGAFCFLAVTGEMIESAMENLS